MRTVGEVESLINRLTKWRDRRAEISADPDRTGKPLRNTELGEAVLYLSEYRDSIAEKKETVDVH